MPLYDRLMGRDDAGNLVANKIPIHQFQAAAAEWARGRITGAQANTIIQTVSGAALDAGEQAEAQTLVNTVQPGTTTANKADRAMRWFEIDQILMLADSNVPGYDTPTAVKAKLGV